MHPSPVQPAAPEALLRRPLRGPPGRGPGDRGCVPTGYPGLGPRTALAGLLPGSLFSSTMARVPVSVLAQVSVRPPFPARPTVPVSSHVPVPLPGPVPGSVPGPLDVAVSVPVRAPLWVSLSRTGPGLASPHSISHGWIPVPARPETTRGQQPTTSVPGRWPGLRTGRRQLTCAHAHSPSGGPQRVHLPLAARGRSWCLAGKVGVEVGGRFL